MREAAPAGADATASAQAIAAAANAIVLVPVILVLPDEYGPGLPHASVMPSRFSVSIH